MTTTGHDPRTSATRSGRLPELDNLRSLLVAWIIFGHALLGYTAYGGWEYAEVREATLAPPEEVVLSAIFGPSALIVIGTLFLVAGLFLPGSLAAHGHRRFVRRRLLRLGGPYLAFAVVLWPLLLWSTYRAAGRDVSYWWIFTGRRPFLDAGALWFAGVLLIFSLGYAGAVRVGLLRAGAETSAGPVRGRHVAAVTVSVATVSFLVRLWLPAKGSLPGDLHLWEWPQCLGLLGLGVVGARRGLLQHVPDGLRRGSGRAVVAALLTVPVAAIATGVGSLDGSLTPYLGGWSREALYAAGVEATLVVSGSVWLLGTAQRRLTGQGRVAASAARAAFAAYVLQGPVLLALALAARPLPVAALAKAAAVGGAGVAVSFALGWLVVDRTVLGRVL